MEVANGVSNLTRGIAGIAARAAAAVADIIYPPKCLACGGGLTEDDSPGICVECLGRMPLISGNSCLRCGAPVGEFSAAEECIECRGRTFAFSTAVAAGRYSGVLREMILQLKYGRRTVLARPLGLLMAERALSRNLSGGLDMIVPVPLHRNRLRKRGFNQAHLLAERAADALGLRAVRDVLVRAVDTVPQTDLEKPDRRKNVSGAFSVRRDVRGVRILLVDDVLTTGSTLSECASILIQAGAEEVRVLTAARSTRS